MKLKLASAFLCTALMYCGGGGSGGSGVDDGAAVGELSAAEAADLCEYLITLQPVRTVTCDVDGQTVTVELGTPAAEVAAEVDSCVEDLTAATSCTATVGQAEACAEGNADQIADLSDAEICDIVAGGPEPAPIAACAVFDTATCDF